MILCMNYTSSPQLQAYYTTVSLTSFSYLSSDEFYYQLLEIHPHARTRTHTHIHPYKHIPCTYAHHGTVYPVTVYCFPTCLSARTESIITTIVLFGSIHIVRHQYFTAVLAQCSNNADTRLTCKQTPLHSLAMTSRKLNPFSR